MTHAHCYSEKDALILEQVRACRCPGTVGNKTRD